MRLGLLPGQQRALAQAFKKARKFDDFRGRTRRRFLLAAMAGVGASIGTFFVGRATATAIGPTQEPSVALSQARGLATGPLTELVASYPTFLLMLERSGHDSTLWTGFARLVDVAVERDDPTLARHLLQSAVSPPDAIKPLTLLLQPIARR